MTQQTPITTAQLQARVSAQPELAIALLQQVFPPASVVVVGANRLNPVWLSWSGMNAQDVLLIDAQAERLQAVQRYLPHARAWRTQEALLDATVGTATFHELSHAGESGLLPADELHALWPNLRTAQATERPTTTLDALLAQDADLGGSAGPGENGWLIVDCLPGVRLLQGAMERLRHCSVVGVRVLTGAAAEFRIEGASIDAARALLEPMGLRHAFNLEETHPGIVTAVFVREAAGALGEEAFLTEVRNEVQKKEAQIAALIQETSELAASRDEQIAKLMEERDQALKQHKDQSTRMQQLEAENAEAHHRHQLMQDEMIKAEAQIELIKDLLLREQGL